MILWFHLVSTCIWTSGVGAHEIKHRIPWVKCHKGHWCSWAMLWGVAATEDTPLKALDTDVPSVEQSWVLSVLLNCNSFFRKTYVSEKHTLPYHCEGAAFGKDVFQKTFGWRILRRVTEIGETSFSWNRHSENVRILWCTWNNCWHLQEDVYIAWDCSPEKIFSLGFIRWFFFKLFLWMQHIL